MAPALVALRLPPGEAFRRALHEVWADGCAVAPLDPHAPQEATRRLLTALRPERLLDERGVHRLDGGVEVTAATALVVATSSHVKAAMLSFEALEASTRAGLDRLGARAGDRWLCCLPTHHIAGLQVLLRARALGGEAAIHERFDPAAVDAEPGITHVSLVPTMLVRLLDAGADVARFSAILLGGAAPPQGLVERARRAGARVVTTYGMTETCGGFVYDGQPLDGFEARVGGDGRIRVRGPVMDGYRLRADLTHAAFEDGWLVSSDLGVWRGGRLQVLGRTDDVVVSGGENLDAAAVGDVLRRHPDVTDAAAVGRPDPEWGEVLVAYCVAAAGRPRPSDAALADLVRAALGPRAAPRAIRWVPTIPRTALGKVRRDLLMRENGRETAEER